MLSTGVRAVACFSYSPSRWLSKHLPLRDAACDAFALDRCRLLRWQGPDWTNAPTFLRFRRACVRWLVFPTSLFRWLTTPLSGFALTSTCVLFAALRACWSRRSQVDVRARRALSGAGDRPSSRRSVPQRDGGYLSRSYSDVARASVASSRRSFRASPFGMCSSPVPALLSRCFCDTAT